MIKRVAATLTLALGTAAMATGCSFSVGDMKPLGAPQTPTSVAPSNTPTTNESTEPSAASTPSVDALPSSQPSEDLPQITGGKVSKVTLELKIASGIGDKVGTMPVVTCDQELLAQVGATTECVAEGSSLPGGRIPLKVTVTEVVGTQVNFDYEQI